MKRLGDIFIKNKIIVNWQQINNYSLDWDELPDLTLYQASMIISKLVALGEVPVAFGYFYETESKASWR